MARCLSRALETLTKTMGNLPVSIYPLKKKYPLKCQQLFNWGGAVFTRFFIDAGIVTD